MKRSITIEFDSDEVAMHFAEWLCGSGEQQYWDWMRYRESDEEDDCTDITVVDFDYWGPKNDFMSDWTIRTKSGRLDK